MSVLQPIDIRSPGFFWLLQPWKDGTLATLDGWGRYAEISFIGLNRMRIRHLVGFPNIKQDRRLITWPEAGVITSTTGKMQHIAAIDNRKTKSHIPLMTWVLQELFPVLIDPIEGLVAYSYVSDKNVYSKLFIYNYKEDMMIYESNDNSTIYLSANINENYALGYNSEIIAGKMINKKIFYNWKNSEILENDLTEALNVNTYTLSIRPYWNVHQGKRFMFQSSRILDQRIKISWNEEYSDVKITPLSYLIPRDRTINNLIISTDGAWGTTFIGGYRGLRDERLYKRVFFHLDARYPNGISIPVITDDYEVFKYDYSAFVNHPVHGMCFAQEWYKNKRQFLRLYKMSDVQAEINRQILEKANQIRR